MKPTQTRSRSEKSRLQLLHQYYKYTGFYAFVWQSVKKATPYIIAFLMLIYILDYFFNINATLINMTEILPAFGVLTFFFASETVLGLVPPEIFIAWSSKLNNPWFYLFVLASLSYFGGLLAYWIGQTITKIPSVHDYFETKMDKHLKKSRKWGGFLIIVGALLPLPFSMSCMAAGLIKFPFKNVMRYGSLRFVRFAIYGVIIFNVL